MLPPFQRRAEPPGEGASPLDGFNAAAGVIFPEFLSSRRRWAKMACTGVLTKGVKTGIRCRVVYYDLFGDEDPEWKDRNKAVGTRTP